MQIKTDCKSVVIFADMVQFITIDFVNCGQSKADYKSASIFADMAQLAEQLICNQQVIGSSPIVGFVDHTSL